MTTLQVPTKLSEALRLAAELAARNEELEEQLHHLRRAPEILRPKHIMELFGVSKSTISEWAQEWEANPDKSPLLNKLRRKGESVVVIRDELIEWLKMRGTLTTRR